MPKTISGAHDDELTVDTAGRFHQGKQSILNQNKAGLANHSI
jgi:hypothetical protein